MYRLRVLNQLKGRLTDLPLYAYQFKNTSSLTIRGDPTFIYIQDLLVAVGAMGLSLNAHLTVFVISGTGLYSASLKIRSFKNTYQEYVNID